MKTELSFGWVKMICFSMKALAAMAVFSGDYDVTNYEDSFDTAHQWTNLDGQNLPPVPPGSKYAHFQTQVVNSLPPCHIYFESANNLPSRCVIKQNVLFWMHLDFLLALKGLILGFYVPKPWSNYEACHSGRLQITTKYMSIFEFRPHRNAITIEPMTLSSAAQRCCH